MKYLGLIILQFLMQLNLYSSEVALKLLDKDEYLRRGKITKVIFTTKNNKFVSDIKLNGKNISLNQWLYLFSVEFIQDSKDGESQIGSTIVLKELPIQKEIQLKIDKEEYSLSLLDIKFHPDDASLNATKTIFQENYDFQRVWLWLIENTKVLLVIFLFISSAIMFLFFKVQKKRQIEKKLKEKREYWHQKIKHAESRDDIEKIYQAKTEWSKFFSSPTMLASIEDFLNYLNSIQYSKDWHAEQFEQIIIKLENMKKNIS